jgi:hypothetical protein
MKKIRKLLVFMALSCFAALFLSSEVSAVLGIECACITECCCGVDCDCPPEADCGCNNECICEITLCHSCDMIVKQREALERQTAVLSAIDITTPSLTIMSGKSDILRICTASIVEDCIRMNN